MLLVVAKLVSAALTLEGPALESLVCDKRDKQLDM